MRTVSSLQREVFEQRRIFRENSPKALKCPKWYDGHRCDRQNTSYFMKMSSPAKVSPTKATSRAMTIKNFEQLAEVLKEKGKLLESEDLYRNAVIGKEKVFGTNHPETLAAKHSLALILEAERKFEDAEEMYKHVIMIREMMQGPMDPVTCNSKFCYADMLRKIGRKKESLGLFQQACDGYLESLGAEHENTKLARKRIMKVEKEMKSCSLL